MFAQNGTYFRPALGQSSAGLPCNRTGFVLIFVVVGISIVGQLTESVESSFLIHNNNNNNNVFILRGLHIKYKHELILHMVLCKT